MVENSTIGYSEVHFSIGLMGLVDWSSKVWSVATGTETGDVGKKFG